MGFLRLKSGGMGPCLSFCFFVKGYRAEGSCLGYPLSFAVPSRLVGRETRLGFKNSGMQK